MTIRHRYVSLACKGFVLVFLLTLAGAREAIASSETFGQCLTRSGAAFYGASWCPVCKRQRGILGRAMSRVRYVECSVDGKRGRNTPECREAEVESYPTWVFGDGSRASGSQSLASLASRSGCSLASPATSNEGRDAGGATESEGSTDAIPVQRSRTGGGGALVIEIP
jgi:hypothetical protein